MIDELALARALHVLFIIHWIGGVAFVTFVALPLALANEDSARGWALFEAIERRFAAQVRFSIPLAGLAGLWLTSRLDLWSRFADLNFWWMDAMAGLWALFMLIVFVVEPHIHERLERMAALNPHRALRRVTLAHAVLLTLATVTILGAVGGAQGGLFH